MENELTTQIARIPDSAPLFIKDFAEKFKWKTMDGDELEINEISTGHLFNILKMLYNHWAIKLSLPTVWHKNEYRDIYKRVDKMPKEIAKTILFAIWVIEWRNDLPFKYLMPYSELRKIILSLKLIPGNLNMLEITNGK